jgi:putative isomerase
MMKLLGILLFCFLSISLACPENYPNVMNLQGVPSSASDETVYGFSDMGAWHLFSLPLNLSFAGGFTGPNVLNGIGFVGQSFLQLESLDDPFTQGQFKYYPGSLVQTLESSQGLIFTQKLIYSSKRTSFIQLSIRNPTSNILRAQLGWIGAATFVDTNLYTANVSSTLGSGILATLKNGMIIEVRLPLYVKATSTIKSKSYRLDLDPITINPNQTWESALTFSVLFNRQEQVAEELLLPLFFGNASTYFQMNTDRWNGYISNAILPSNSNWWATVKALEVLMTNWRSSVNGTAYKHDGVYPSYFTYQGYWAWDSWKHAVALATINPALAKDQIRAMWDCATPSEAAFQGMVCDVLYVSGAENWRNTKPPLASWAVSLVANRSSQPDLEFINEMYSKLVNFHQWWYLYRDVDNNGLCEYGSTDGTAQAAKWESGMDNAVRFDNTSMVENDRAPHSFSFNQESVDLNSYLYVDKLYLADLADLIGRDNEAATFRQQAAKLKTQIQETFFDPVTGFFYDRRLSNGPFIDVQGPEGWLPLWAGVATFEQADAVRDHMLNSSTFDLYVPCPTVQADAEEYDPITGYWRGPMWFDQAYFGVKGLHKAGFQADAEHMATKLLTNSKGFQPNDQTPLHEYYNPNNGDALGAPFFGWTAAHVLMMVNGI